MKNNIRSKGRVWKRRSKNLKSGEIQCWTCGEWKKVPAFQDKHFKVEYHCRSCTKVLNEDKPKNINQVSTPKKIRPKFPDNCPHKPFFWCKRASECIGCYYNPDKKIALMTKDPDDPKKTAKNDWFYGNKKHAKECLEILEDIKYGRGLRKGGTRSRFKHAREKEDEDEQ